MKKYELAILRQEDSLIGEFFYNHVDGKLEGTFFDNLELLSSMGWQIVIFRERHALYEVWLQREVEK